MFKKIRETIGSTPAETHREEDAKIRWTDEQSDLVAD